MVQDTISNAILIIAVVIATTVVLTAIYPAVFNAAGSVRSATDDAGSRAGTSVSIVTHGFSDDYTQLNIWMKNTGNDKIAETGSIKVYYGDGSGSMKRYQVGESSIYSPDPAGSGWSPGETMTIGIVDSPSSGTLPHEPGIHVVKIVLSSGAESEYTFTI
jgi:archaellum component FlaG (FlaF/FlaG flagellin family)